MKIVVVFIAVLLLLTIILLVVLRLREDSRAKRLWNSLKVSGDSEVVFTLEMLEGLPEVAQRYLQHAIATGTPLARRVEIGMAGSIQPNPGGAWMPFEAQQILTPGRGFIWQAKAMMAGFLPVHVTDSYARGDGRMKVTLLGFLPGVNASNPDVAKSAAGRLSGEYLWLPAALLPQNGAQWEEIDSTHARVTLSLDDLVTPLILTIDEADRLKEVVFPRWLDSEKKFVPFGVVIEEEGTFDGYTIPVKLNAGWWYGTERYREFFRAEIKDAAFYQ